MASAGIGSAPHMYWELFRSLTGVDMLHVPYRGGGPAVIDLLGGQVQVYFGTSASSIEYIRAGKLRALAVTTATRAAALPDVPAMAEFLPTYEASIYVGIAAPRSTPVEIINTLNQDINLALTDSAMLQHIAELGDTPLSLSASSLQSSSRRNAEMGRRHPSSQRQGRVTFAAIRCNLPARTGRSSAAREQPIGREPRAVPQARKLGPDHVLSNPAPAGRGIKSPIGSRQNT